MRRISVTELKARLSKYLREVQRGEEIEIVNRGRPVALLTAVRPSAQDNDQDGRRRRLIAAGVLRAGTGDARAILEKPLLTIPGLLDALDEERRDRF